MIRNADRHRKDLSFSKGDWAFVKLQPYKQISIKGEYHKLSKRYFGPYQIIEKIGLVAYSYKTKYVSYSLHLSCFLVKETPWRSHAQIQQLLSDSVDNGPIIQPAAILASKQHKYDSTTQKMVLVQWVGLPVEAISWQDLSKL